MALSDNMRLYDIATRLAVYTEDVKVWQAKQFAFVLREVGETLTVLLSRVRYKTLDGLSKRELNKLIMELRQSQSKIYTVYTAQLIEQLKDFMKADLEVNRRVWATAYKELDEEEVVSDEEATGFILANRETSPLFGISAVAGNDGRLWSQIVNLPIPANGLYLLPFLQVFSNSAQTGVENIIRKAWSNRATVEETLTELIGNGESVQGTPSQINRINTQAAAVIHTTITHVGAVVGAGVMSAVFERYAWHSIVDGRTTRICLDRNLKVWRFGEGPLPPAHIYCRSHVAPYVAGSDIVEETFYSWVLRQPTKVQNDVLSEAGSKALRQGKLKASDVPKYESNKPLTHEQFRKKINQILSR